MRKIKFIFPVISSIYSAWNSIVKFISKYKVAFLLMFGYYIADSHLIVDDLDYELDFFYKVSVKLHIHWFIYDIAEYIFKGLLFFLLIKRSKGEFELGLFLIAFLLNIASLVVYLGWYSSVWFETESIITIVALYILLTHNFEMKLFITTIFVNLKNCLIKQKNRWISG